MVDFPEGYGFAPNDGKLLVQERFVVGVGVYEKATRNPTLYRSKHRNTPGRGGSPWEFVPIGYVFKNDNKLFGSLSDIGAEGPVFYGTLQEICTAMCTVHRLTGVRTGVKT